MKLYTKVAYNTIIQVISKVFSTALALFAVALITRYLGTEGYGSYTTIITFLSFFGIIADLGLTLVTVQLISQPNTDEEKVLGNLFALRLVSAILFLGLAPLSALLFPYSSDIKLGILITTLSFLFIALNQILVGLFQKKLRMDKASIAEVVSRLVLVGGMITVVKMGYGLNGALIVTVLSSLFSFALHFAFARSFVRIKLRFDLKYWKLILLKSWPLAITIALNLLYLKTDTLLLSIIPRETDIGIMSEVGIYGAAYKVIDVLITLPFMFAGIVLPIMTARWAEKDKNTFNYIMQKSFDLMAIIAVPTVFGTLLLADQIMVFVAGNDFFMSGQILKYLIFASTAIYLGNVFAHAIIAIDKQKKVISAYIFVALTSIIGYLILIPKFSYLGAAWVTIYSETIIALASYIIVYKYTKFIPNFTTILKSLLSALVMYFSTKYLLENNINFFVLILFSIFIYFLTLILIKGLSKKDLLGLLNK